LLTVFENVMVFPAPPTVPVTQGFVSSVQSLSTVPPTNTQLHVVDIVKTTVRGELEGAQFAGDGVVTEIQLAKGVKSIKLANAVPPKLGLHPLPPEGHVAFVRVCVAHVARVAYWME
jgi:hypothetical protein